MHSSAPLCLLEVMSSFSYLWQRFSAQTTVLTHAALHWAGEVIWIPFYSHGCLMEERSFVCFLSLVHSVIFCCSLAVIYTSAKLV